MKGNINSAFAVVVIAIAVGIGVSACTKEEEVIVAYPDLKPGDCFVNHDRYDPANIQYFVGRDDKSTYFLKGYTDLDTIPWSLTSMKHDQVSCEHPSLDNTGCIGHYAKIQCPQQIKIKTSE